MKKWEKPGLAILNAGDTKETKDIPHLWECNACKKHNYSIIDGKAPEKCYYCGSTAGFEFVLFEGQDNAVIIPEFGDTKPSLAPTVS